MRYFPRLKSWRPKPWPFFNFLKDIRIGQRRRTGSPSQAGGKRKQGPDPALDTATETDSRKVDTQAHDAPKPNDNPKSEKDAAAGAESSEKKQGEKNGPLEENPSNTAFR
jgi:hypothetical protein